MALSSLHFLSSPIQSSPVTKIQVRAGKQSSFNLSIRAQEQTSGNGRRIWRRRKLTKKDEKIRYDMDHNMQRIPFLEEQVRKIKDGGKQITGDIARLLLSEENRYDFVNEVAAEATEYVDNNQDEYGGSKKAILHVLTNRLNDSGTYRPDAYVEPNPYKPRGYVREELL